MRGGNQPPSRNVDDETMRQNPVLVPGQFHNTFSNPRQHKIIEGDQDKDSKARGSKTTKVLPEACRYYQENDEDEDDLAAAFYANQSKPQNQLQQRRLQHESLVNDWIEIIPGLEPADLEAPNANTNNATDQAIVFRTMNSEEEDLLELAARCRVEIKNMVTQSAIEDLKAL